MAASFRSLHAATVPSLLQRLSSVAIADAAAAQLSRALLSPLEHEDSERGNNLIATLRAYYDCGARVDKTADRMFLHRNSVRYRLDRIRSLLRLDIDHPHSIAVLTIALLCWSAAGNEKADAS